jgi:hypothetical protein
VNTEEATASPVGVSKRSNTIISFLFRLEWFKTDVYQNSYGVVHANKTSNKFLNLKVIQNLRKIKKFFQALNYNKIKRFKKYNQIKNLFKNKPQ